MKESQNITRSTLWTIMSQLPAHVFGILAGVFITRVLGPEGRGLYTIFYTNIVLFCTVFGFSITNSIVFFTANSRISHNRLKSIIIVLLAITFLLSVFTLVIWMNSGYNDLFLPNADPTVLLVVLFLSTILVTQVNAAFTAFFQGLRHFRIVNLVLILNGIYGCVLFFIAYMLHIYDYYHFDLAEIVYISLVILLFNTVHWVFYYFRYEQENFRFYINWQKDFRIFFKFTVMNHVSNILHFFNHRMILWIIAFYLDNWQLGIFSLGMGLAQLLYLFSTPLTLVLESFLSSEKTENRGELFSRFSRIQFTAVLIVCIIAASVSPFIVPLIYGRDFTSSVAILNTVMVGVIMSCQSGIISSFFLASNRLKHNVISSAIGVVVTIILAPMLIAEYQLMGAAFAQVFTYLSILIYLLIAVRLEGGIDSNLFFITRSDIRFIRRQLRMVKNKNQETD